MGNSLTNYDGYAFWEKDHIIMAWLCLLVRQIDKFGPNDSFEKELREQYVTHGTVCFGGAQYPGLDRYITTPERRE